MIKKITWKNVLEKIKDNAPQAYNALSILEIKESESFYLLKYTYGSNIINQNGEFLLPNGNSLSSNNTKALTEIKPQKILPTALLLKGQCEKYIEFEPHFSKEQQLYSIGLHRAGEFIDIQATHHQALLPTPLPTLYQLSSGLRTAFIIPGIKDKVLFKKLCQQYPFCNNLYPNNFSNQWHLFRALINETEFKNKWHTELILFPNIFYNALKFNPHKMDLSKSIEANTKDSIENVLWDVLIKNHHADDYNFVNAAKNILLAGLSKKPLYHFVDNDEAGPYSTLSKIFLDHYQWEHYDALFMKPTYLNWLKVPIGFYSINNIYQKSRIYRSLLTRSIRIKEITDSILEKAKNHKNIIDKSRLKGLGDIELNFYHSKNTVNSQFNEFNSITPLPNTTKNSTKKIPNRNSFLYCCIQITKKYHSNI